MATKQPNELTAIEALEQIQAGTLTSEALVASCLERIAEREDTVGAWHFFSAEQALDALFGGPAPRSQVEAAALSRAGEAEPGIRSAVGDPHTPTVAKGRVTRDIIAAPEGDGGSAQAVIPG